MTSMAGVPSSLILRNESWVRQRANALARRLPSNVERADLIQVGLIAVAQAAVGFVWEGDRDSEEARAAFVRYAQSRVNGAMLDELRQMDHLTRSQRRNVKVVQVARQQWQAMSDAPPSAADLSRLCGLDIEAIFQADSDARIAQEQGGASDDEADDRAQQAAEPATPQDEVEARVETGMLMRRLESFFAGLPETERRVIDAYLGIGLTPVKLAEELQISPSRISQMFKSLRERIGQHLAPPMRRSLDRIPAHARAGLDELIEAREERLEKENHGCAWTRRLESALLARDPRQPPEGRITVTGETRWG